VAGTCKRYAPDGSSLPYSLEVGYPTGSCKLPVVVRFAVLKAVTEDCLLGYKNPVRTSQETHYVSATESSQLMLCKI
jgi:hypothetical protein